MTLKALGMGVLAVAALWGSAQTAQADAIVVTTMDINDCKEVGICDWRLHCMIEGNQWAFIKNSEANTNESIDVFKQVTLTKGYPTFVSCHVWEHDGGIGASWENVGTVSTTFTGPLSEPVTLNVENDEGDVSIQIFPAANALKSPTQEDQAQLVAGEQEKLGAADDQDRE
jgi:hypothetical protein